MVYRGGVAEERLHHNYQLRIGDLRGENIRTLLAHDEEEIVGFIPRIPKGEWVRELTQKKIQLTDYTSSSPEIEVLVGNDYEGMLLTGQIASLKCGVTAVQYVWGWALSGRRPTSLRSTAVSLLACQSPVAVKRESQSEDNKASRHAVCLPWRVRPTATSEEVEERPIKRRRKRRYFPHPRSHFNPADLPYRGHPQRELIESRWKMERPNVRWWEGMEWRRSKPRYRDKSTNNNNNNK
ncbi:hypothetical protein Fcan01_11155 [Folsomia candida]|uniref:Uncharacterized protein n=1 Tax=Folsomia candida TaxID=158441 RepID=A0A226EC73_FOLCA|nr:hypothetical protein Fcan01_11155 [Folsomia candida]